MRRSQMKSPIKRLRVWGLPHVVVAALLFVVPAAADAPATQYERFDQDSATIKDSFTKLEWDRNGVIRGVSEDVADAGCSFVASLENTGRLPTVKELLTIVDESPHNEYDFKSVVAKFYDQGAFDGTPIDLPYWTSTPAASAGVDMFWTVDFGTGLMHPLAKTGKANARCVR
jgi:hypothetical protein